ncbi:MAG: carbohydrate kinase family protein [Ruminococcaceae bacterium]|nr:carbohydrate kinase family protein [Oscillospiraceae bacterium]
MSEKTGISVAGTVLLDKINEISAYPESGELTKISSIKLGVGGCVPNVSCDLKKIRPDLDVYAIGKIGTDADGKYIVDYLNNAGVNTEKIITDPGDNTSMTQVMSVTGGQRTFFTYPGTSSTFGYSDIDFDALDAKILHLGYFLLLDKVDSGDGLKILAEAKKRGIKTSIDLVSENSDRYSLVLPCLPYTDYLIINELEASKLTGIEPTNENLEKISRKLMELGVKEKVIIHKPDLATALSDEGFTVVPSFEVSKNDIKGTTGAGDAFCAGALIGIYDSLSDKEILEFASSVALVSLFAPDATSGIVNEEEIKKICENKDRKRICL